jgi:hypothetical protein
MHSTTSWSAAAKVDTIRFQSVTPFPQAQSSTCGPCPGSDFRPTPDDEVAALLQPAARRRPTVAAAGRPLHLGPRRGQACRVRSAPILRRRRAKHRRRSRRKVASPVEGDRLRKRRRDARPGRANAPQRADDRTGPERHGVILCPRGTCALTTRIAIAYQQVGRARASIHESGQTAELNPPSVSGEPRTRVTRLGQGRRVSAGSGRPCPHVGACVVGARVRRKVNPRASDLRCCMGEALLNVLIIGLSMCPRGTCALTRGSSSPLIG